MKFLDLPYRYAIKAETCFFCRDVHLCIKTPDDVEISLGISNEQWATLALEVAKLQKTMAVKPQ
jgi:hypothetical protein